MSFIEVLNEVSLSNNFASVRLLIEKYLFDENLHQTSIEQEKLLCVCLRKLSNWFVEERQQIQMNFIRYFLQIPIFLKQKQLIHLLLNELKRKFDDYLLFLLIELYEKNYVKLLNELEEEGDVAFIVHLPDRVSNVSMKKIPKSFQCEIYFHRLSLFIENELLKRHYSNVNVEIVSFLCQLVHKASKLGKLFFIASWNRGGISSDDSNDFSSVRRKFFLFVEIKFALRVGQLLHLDKQIKQNIGAPPRKATN